MGSGIHLLSHAVSSIVPSAARVFTPRASTGYVFGMGTCVSPVRIGTSNSSLLSFTSITKQYNQLPYFASLSTASYSRSRCTQDISYPGAPHSKKQAFSRGFPLLHVILFLRKEVIQPHLPIRLPCYDFTPVTGPTFDCSLL